MTSQSRVQSGIPSGGEFAPSAKPSSGLSLADQPARIELTPGLADAIADASKAAETANARKQALLVRGAAETVRRDYPGAATLVMDLRSGDYGDYYWPSHLRGADGRMIAGDVRGNDGLNECVVGLDTEGGSAEYDIDDDVYLLDIAANVGQQDSPGPRQELHQARAQRDHAQRELTRAALRGLSDVVESECPGATHIDLFASRTHPAMMHKVIGADGEPIGIDADWADAQEFLAELDTRSLAGHPAAHPVIQSSIDTYRIDLAELREMGGTR